MQWSRVVALAALVGACGGKVGGAPELSTALPDASPVDACTLCASDAGRDAATVDAGAGDSLDISRSAFSLIEAETYLAVSGSVVVAAWIGVSGIGGVSSIGYRFSRDGGKSWEPVQKIEAPGGRFSSDPVVAADGTGNVYLAWVGFQIAAGNEPVDMQIYVAKAAAGSSTFAPPAVVSDPSSTAELDKPWIAVTGKGTIVVTYASVDMAQSTETIVAARSTDGSAFTRVDLATGSGHRNLAMPCVAADALYVVYLGEEGLVLRRSDDDGASFPSTHATTVAKGSQLTFDDPACVAAGDLVWVQWEETTGTTTAATVVKVAASSDRGGVFGEASLASDQPLAYHAQLAREPGGALDLVYYAGRSDPDPAGSYRRTRSLDGKAWSPSVAVVEGLTFLTDRQTALWLGDYPGVVATSGALFTAFTENRSGQSHVAFARIGL